jgi:hypothetical protein
MDTKEAPSKDEIAVGYFDLVLLLFFFPFFVFSLAIPNFLNF